MPLPPWTIELLRRGVNDLAQQVSDPDKVEQLKQQATRLVEDLPRVAREKVDAVLQQAQSSFDAATSKGSAAKHMASGNAVNASGCLLHPDAGGLAWLPVQSIAASQRHLGESWSGSTGGVQELNALLSERIHERCGVTGLHAFVLPSIDHAMAALTHAVDVRRLWVPRWSAVPMNSAGDVLADRVRLQQRRKSDIEIHEFGSTMIGDAAVSPESGFEEEHDYIMHLSPIGPDDQLRVLGPRSIMVMPHGRWFSDNAVDFSRVPLSGSVEQAIKDGVSGVVLGTGVLTGCPQAAVVVADEELARRIQAGDGFSLRLGAACLAAMVTESVAVAEKGSLPVDVLMNAPEENLVSRAERLAIQLSASDRIQSVRVTDRPATIATDSSVTLPSRQVELAIHGDLAHGLHQQLRQQNPAILTAVIDSDNSDEGGNSDEQSGSQHLLMDLRWVTSDEQVEIAKCLTEAMS